MFQIELAADTSTFCFLAARLLAVLLFLMMMMRQNLRRILWCSQWCCVPSSTSVYLGGWVRAVQMVRVVKTLFVSILVLPHSLACTCKLAEQPNILIHRCISPAPSAGRSAIAPALPGGSSAVDNEDWLSRMRRTEKKLAVFYGSQTGTAEEYAQRIVKEARS